MVQATALASSSGGSRQPRVLVAIPCLNEEIAIAGVVVRSRQHASEVLVIDDGSTDHTAEVARLAGAKVIPHERNLGKGAAVRAALRYAKANGFDALVLIDGDGQHNPAEIPLMVDPLFRPETPVDVALGFRFGEMTEMPAYRRVGKRVLDYATAVTSGAPVTDSQCGFRGLGRKAIEALAEGLRSDDFAVESEMITVAQDRGLKMENVPIHCRYDGIDGSTKNPVTHGVGVLNALVIALTMRRPLLTLGLPGFASLMVGAYYGFRMIQIYYDFQIFVMSYALAAATLVILGSIAIATALMMNMLILMRKTFGDR